MPMKMTTELYDALRDIRSSFLDDLASHVGDMEELCKYLDKPDYALTAVAGLREIVHKISGIAGSVGFSEMGEVAAKLDIAFGGLLKKPYDPAAIDALRAPLEALLDRLEDAFDETLLPPEAKHA